MVDVDTAYSLSVTLSHILYMMGMIAQKAIIVMDNIIPFCIVCIEKIIFFKCEFLLDRPASGDYSKRLDAAVAIYYLYI
jgi:hypothetical protein